MLRKSPVKNKKYRIVYNGKKIDFGDSRYEDYTTHKDPERRKNYLKRHASRENWSDPYTPGFWSRWLLWEKPSLSAAIKAISKKKF